MRKIPVVWLCAFFLISPTAFGSKCPFARYQVTGQIQTPPGIDHTQFRILLFIADSPRPSDYPPDAGKEDFVQPDADGRFQVSGRLSTESRLGCDRIASTGSLIIVAKGAESQRRTVTFENRRKIRKTLAAAVDLGVILIRKH